MGKLEIGCHPGSAEDGDRCVLLELGNDHVGLMWHAIERMKVTKAMETTLQRAVLKIVTIVNQNKDHIPPITTSETNPFPYQIILNPRLEGWTKTAGVN